MRNTWLRPLVAFLLVALVLAVARPVDAETSRQRRDTARRRQAQLAQKLNALRASDAQLEKAVAVLNRQVSAQQAAADSARQAVLAALAAVAQAEARIAATEKEMNRLRSAVVNRAISAYVHPNQQSFATVIAANDLSEASRRQTLLDQVTNHDRDVIDQLRAVREDLGIEQAAAARARDIANDRRRAVVARLGELQTAQREKQRLATALDARIREYQVEADAVAREEANLTALIRSRELARASRGGIDPGVDGRVSGAGLIWPLRGQVTSPYGYRWGRMHTGIDIDGNTGNPIRAAKGGEVIFAGYMGGYGNCVVVNHGGGFSTLYAHQSRIAASDGAEVGQGQVIGYVGSTGHSTGPHLHFETRVNGSPQNPMRYLP